MNEIVLAIIGVVGTVFAIAVGLSEWRKRAADNRDTREQKILHHAEQHASLDKRLALVEQSHLDLAGAVDEVKVAVVLVQADVKTILRSLNGSVRPKD